MDIHFTTTETTWNNVFLLSQFFSFQLSQLLFQITEELMEGNDSCEVHERRNYLFFFLLICAFCLKGNIFALKINFELNRMDLAMGLKCHRVGVEYKRLCGGVADK